MALTDNLIAHWKLDETSDGSGAVTRNDSHGAFHLTDNNTTASGTGKLGSAANFELDNAESLSHADHADLEFAASSSVAFTLAAWVNYESVSGTRTIVAKGTLSTADAYFLYQFNSTTLRFRVGNGSSVGVLDTAWSPSTGTWYFVVAVHDPSDTDAELKVYINAGAPSEGAWAGGTGGNTQPFSIGARSGGAANLMDGLIDSVSFWKRALSSTEITELYNSGNGLDYDSWDAGGSGEVAGASAGVAAATATLRGTGGLVAISAGTATALATLAANGALVGLSDGIAATSGALGGRGNLSVSSAGEASASATLAGIASLSGTSAGIAAALGALVADGTLIGLSVAGSTAFGTLIDGTTIIIECAGTSAGVATASGTVRGFAWLIPLSTVFATRATRRNVFGSTLTGPVYGSTPNLWHS